MCSALSSPSLLFRSAFFFLRALIAYHFLVQRTFNPLPNQQQHEEHQQKSPIAPRTPVQFQPTHTQTMLYAIRSFSCCFSSQPRLPFPILFSARRPTNRPILFTMFHYPSFRSPTPHFHFGIVQKNPHLRSRSRASRTPPAPTHYLSGRNKIPIEISIACSWIP